MQEGNERELWSLVPSLLHLCRAAGEAILGHYHGSGAGHYRSKADDSPLTRADLAAHRVLLEGLSTLEPLLPVLSEESVAPPPVTRRAWPAYWLVDPLDGTREYLDRTGDFTINIALVERHRPVLGLIHAPLPGLSYAGVPGAGARVYRAGVDGTGAPVSLATRPLQAGRPLVSLVGRRHRGPQLRRVHDWLAHHWAAVERCHRGGAIKFCLLAEGRADVYARFSPCSEWDVAAGQALLEAAGGRVLGMDGEPLRYNRRNSLESPHFIAVADTNAPLWRDLLRALEA